MLAVKPRQIIRGYGGSGINFQCLLIGLGGLIEVALLLVQHPQHGPGARLAWSYARRGLQVRNGLIQRLLPSVERAEQCVGVVILCVELQRTLEGFFGGIVLF